MQLKGEDVVLVAATPASQRVQATPRRQGQRTNQTGRRFFRATRASRPRSATGRRSYPQPQRHGSGLAQPTPRRIVIVDDENCILENLSRSILAPKSSSNSFTVR
jgi:hypothetical protein